MPELDSGAAAPDDKVAAPAAAEQGADNAEKETTTPEEVAKIMHLPAPKASESADKEEAKDAEQAKDDTKEEIVKNEDEAAKDAAEEDAEEEEQPQVKQPAAPADDNDAGEQQFGFTVEDANGKTFEVHAGDNLDEVLKDFVPKSNGQVLQIMRAMDKVETAKAQYEADQEQKAAEADRAQAVQSYRDAWNAEVKDLQAQKRIPEGKDGEDRIAEVYKFMAEENDKRIKAGRQTLNSFEDALDKLENIESREAKAKADKDAKETARKNGALVGGSSAPATSSGPVYRAGSARNANDAIRNLGLLK